MEEELVSMACCACCLRVSRVDVEEEDVGDLDTCVSIACCAFCLMVSRVEEEEEDVGDLDI